MIETARPQDVSRPHKRRPGTPAPETEKLLERYRATMRAELSGLLDEIRPPTSANGQLGIDGSVTVPRKSLEERRALWDLAIKLGRELSSVTLEPGWSGVLDSAPGSALRGRRVDVKAPRLSRRERVALGQE